MSSRKIHTIRNFRKQEGRLRKRLCLTEAGRQLSSYAMRIGTLFDDMEKGMKNWEAFISLCKYYELDYPLPRYSGLNAAR